MDKSIWMHVLAIRERAIELRWFIFACVVVNLFVFSLGLTQSPIGNHDWPRMYGINPSVQLGVGRWFAALLFTATAFKQLPVLNLLLAIVLQIVAAFLSVYVIETFRRRHFSGAYYLIGMLLLTLIPFVTSFHYFTFMSYVFPVAQALMALAVLVACSRRPLYAVLIASLLFCTAMATYQASINTAAVLMGAGLLVSLLAYFRGESLVLTAKLAARFALVFVLGGVLYKFSVVLLDAMGLLNVNAYQLAQASGEELLGRIIEVPEMAIKQLYWFEPYFPVELKISILSICIYGGVLLIRQAVEAQSLIIGAVRALAVVGFAFLMLIGTKVQFFVSADTHYFLFRYSAYGVSTFYLFFTLMTADGNSRFLRRVVSSIIVLVLYGFAIQDLSIQRDLVKQNEYDFRVFNRIVARIEADKAYDPASTYSLVQVGDYLNIKQYHGGYADGNNWSKPHGFTSSAVWDAASMMRKLEPTISIGKNYNLFVWQRYHDPEDGRVLSAAFEYLASSDPWPDRTAVRIIDDDIIIIYLSGSKRIDNLIKDWQRREDAASR